MLRSGSLRLVIQEAWAWLTATQVVRASAAAAPDSHAAAGRAQKARPRLRARRRHQGDRHRHPGCHLLRPGRDIGARPAGRPQGRRNAPPAGAAARGTVCNPRRVTRAIVGATVSSSGEHAPGAAGPDAHSVRDWCRNSNTQTAQMALGPGSAPRPALTPGPNP